MELFILLASLLGVIVYMFYLKDKKATKYKLDVMNTELIKLDFIYEHSDDDQQSNEIYRKICYLVRDMYNMAQKYSLSTEIYHDHWDYSPAYISGDKYKLFVYYSKQIDYIKSFVNENLYVFGHGLNKINYDLATDCHIKLEEFIRDQPDRTLKNMIIRRRILIDTLQTINKNVDRGLVNIFLNQEVYTPTLPMGRYEIGGLYYKLGVKK